jgi:signal transduction histidine kinase/DNA-binding response OmpR family regulator
MILIVDDKEENIFSLQRILELNNFSVDSASSGEDALKKILNNAYSLIILDVQMPGMDGFEVAEALSGFKKAKDIPIIFLSAVNTDKKFITKGYTSGGVDYVTKPVDPDIFILRVKTLVQLFDQNRELNNIRLSLLEEVETRKAAEEQLKETMSAQLSILESLPQIAFSVKPDCSIEFVNEPWFMYSDDAGSMPAAHADDKQVYEDVTKSIEAEKTYVGEVRIKNKSTGEFRYHLLKLVPVRQNSEIRKWIGTFTDIQEQKTANDILEARVQERTTELIAKNKELEVSNYELQQFASVASHDLKEPLRKVQIYSTILKEHFLIDAPEANRNINRVIDASSRMNRLINDLLEYSRLSIDSLFERTNIQELIEEILIDLELSIKEKNALITIGEIPEIDVISGQMRQVFQNLISNALKFSKKDLQPEIRISADILEASGTERVCRIEVSDNGIGFDELYLEKIFTIFQRLNPKEDYEGTGIGLAIVKKIIDKHSGTITARSVEGMGATFIITLPMQHRA